MPSPCTDITKDRTVRLRTAPLWLPERYRLRLSRVRVSFRPSAGERRFLRKRKIELPSVWAPKNRTVTYGPLAGSRWDNSFMPHFRGIMDASFFPSVRYIGNCKVPQSGSSAGVETVLGYVADVAPGPAFVVYPDRDTTSKRSTDYLQPMFKMSPRLRSLLTGVTDDMASLRIKLQAMLIYMGWSGSVTSLGNISARYLVGDEIDKWQEQPTKKETSSLKLFFERARSFKYGAKCWLTSTPTLESGPIWKFMTADAQVIFDYHVPCPDCGVMQEMNEEQVVIDGEETDPRVIAEQDLGLYACSSCGSMWDDRKREKALQAGKWHARGDGREMFAYLKAVHPQKICFHSPGWVSPLVKNSEIAAAKIKSLTSADDLHYYDTQICARAYKPSKQSRKEDSIYILADDRPENLVPGMGQVAALVAGIDTQDNGHPFEIRAFGWGLEQESWQIRFGVASSWPELASILFDEAYQDAEGLYYPVHLAVIDAMGHRTGEVYDFTRQYPGRAQAYKGAQGRRANPQVWTTIDRYPGTKTLIPGGVRLVTADSHHYKDRLAAKLKIKSDAPGAWHLHSGVHDKDPHGRAFASEMSAEYVDERNLWLCPEGKANHYWDCSCLTLVAADILQIKYWQKG